MASRYGGRRARGREQVAEALADVVTEKMRPQALNELLAEGEPGAVDGEGAAFECRVEVAHHTAMNWGGRHDNEDRLMDCRDHHQSLAFHTLGVCDGHDTETASDNVS